MCRKFCPPTGPSSPAQKNPATGISPSISAISPASWSGSANSREPRPLQVNSRAPAARRPPRAAGARVQGAPQILVGRVGVPDVELHGLAHLHLVAHRDGARLGVGADDAADQEVTLARLGLVLVDDHPQLHALGEQLPVPAGQRRGQLLQPGQRRAPAELEDHVAVGPGDGVGVTDRAASLRHQRVDLGVRQVGADGAPDSTRPSRNSRLAAAQPAAGHPAHDQRAGDVLVQVGEQVLGRERERVADHQVNTCRAGPNR